MDPDQMVYFFLSLKVIFVIANSVDLNEMPCLICGITSGSSLFAKVLI